VALNFVPRQEGHLYLQTQVQISATCSVCNAETYLPNYFVWSLSVVSSLFSIISFK
jgi:hypothetical protein